MKKHLLLVLSIFCLFSVFRVDQDYKQRKSFELFLLSEWKNTPELISSTGTPDFPDQAAIQDFLVTLDPLLGLVPADRRFEAMTLTRSFENQYNSKRNGVINWNNIPCNLGGRMRAIAFDPSDKSGKKVWGGAVTGGLWYNNNIFDSNSSWYPVDDFWPNLSISSICFNPENPLEMFVGTGEAQTAVFIYRESSGRGNGIYKSIDGGHTWTLLPSTSDFAYITDIHIRIENSIPVIYAGVVSGKYKGKDHMSFPTDGLYRSTDNGNKWTQVLPFISGKSKPYAPADIEIGAGGRLFVSTMPNIEGDGSAVILYSDSGNAGTWTKYEQMRNTILANGTYPVPGRVMLAAAPSNKNILYAIVGAGYTTPEGYPFSYGQYIYKSLDNGHSWNLRNNPLDPNRKWASLAWHAFAIGVDPLNENSLYIGGLDVYKSEDGGASWARVSDWAKMYYGGGDDYVHADIHCLLYKKNQSDTLLITTDGGVFLSTSASQSIPSFTPRNKGNNTLQFYTCDIKPLVGSTLFCGGLQDNGTVYTNTSVINLENMITGGDGAYCFFDADEPGILITSIYYNRYYFFVDDQYMSLTPTETGIFINPADYDSKNNYIWANAVDMKGSGDQIALTGEVPNNNTTQIIYPNSGTTVPYTHVRVSPRSTFASTTLFLGTMAGRVFKMTDANKSSRKITEIGSNTFPLGAVSCIAVGGSDDTLLVTFSNYGVNSVWYTVNGGLTWESREGNLPDMPIRWAIFHPKNSWQVMLATETGVWITDSIHNPNLTWIPATDGMANVRVDMLRMRESDCLVLAATHGRGLFTATFPYHPRAAGMVKQTEFRAEFFLSGNKLFICKEDLETIQIYDLKGNRIIDRQFSPTTEYQSIDIGKIPKGVYLAIISAYNQKIINKLLIP